MCMLAHQKLRDGIIEVLLMQVQPIAAHLKLSGGLFEGILNGSPIAASEALVGYCRVGDCVR